MHQFLSLKWEDSHLGAFSFIPSFLTWVAVHWHYDWPAKDGAYDDYKVEICCQWELNTTEHGA